MTEQVTQPQHHKERLLIAIDGPSGAGKSTIGIMLAERLNVQYLDTGAMYRAVAYLRLQRGLSEKQLALILPHIDLEIIHSDEGPIVVLDGVNITAQLRTPEISQEASRISTWSSIRKHLVRLQQSLCEKGDYVVEGRDIGTVVLPETPFKFYLDASCAERAQRRQLQLAEQGIQCAVETIEQEITSRDHRDKTREDSPLLHTKGALLIDSTNLSKEEVVQKIIAEIDRIKRESKVFMQKRTRKH